ncbi:L-lactate dehydrogenase complex protein LldG [Chitinophaga eiseniae]|uniref:L-lactate dehydrogenase complex protein LldG n=1 Tax=Chitinophaga eiseniae TaxID=634771 RepID=A0A1T4KCQ5_9BACT|nr:LUD domain-containing protein [Chitinophaga eiseniae]SJZ40238.1 L-lactate dehydrogenase complex protein LldG [Chitinophaga eiseniae]
MENNSRSQALSVIERQLPYLETPNFPCSRADLLAAFESRVKDAGGEVFRPADAVAAKKLLASQHAEAKVICSAAPEISGNRDMHAIKNPHELADVDVVVIRARLGVAENGMVWLTEEDLTVNAPGILPQHLVILLSPQAIVGNMYDAYLRIHLEDTAYGCFMMGPSATADIGAVLVHGAQGARSLCVYLLA